jgi:hypothetical protein
VLESSIELSYGVYASFCYRNGPIVCMATGGVTKDYIDNPHELDSCHSSIIMYLVFLAGGIHLETLNKHKVGLVLVV